MGYVIATNLTSRLALNLEFAKTFGLPTNHTVSSTDINAIVYSKTTETIYMDSLEPDALFAYKKGIYVVHGTIHRIPRNQAPVDTSSRSSLLSHKSKFGEIGAGVGLGANAVRVLEELEILNDVLAKIKPEQPVLRPCRFISGLGEHEVIYDYPVTPGLDEGIGIHRVTFLEALVHLVDPNKTHFNKRCISLSTPSESCTQINFADGTSAEADVVLGADGIRSNVRSYVVGSATQDHHVNGNGNIPASPVRAVFTNTYAYRGLVPTEQLKSLGMKTDLSKTLHCIAGPGKHIITFPIKDGTVINVVAFVCDRSHPWGTKPIPPGQPWVMPRTTSELLTEFAGVWAVHAVDPPLETYIRGRVALLGDAAHGMLPHLGSGASQALEDSLMIAILKGYDTIRRPRGNMVLTKSTKMGNIYDGLGPHGLTPEGLEADVKGAWSEIWHHDLRADSDAAIRELEKAGVF
ncbi:hypothetical protein EW145_g1489 [Phellinidium pouzarii]|uniref:FAD-binding domain-containing protein n=1 Tax=Phellinidium pouzarii TaxID=167371 RepID=A0A4S4LG33_9AGAM|nr:hypothetical protein EW145_g1489 [Phellinidium pouzarii]